MYTEEATDYVYGEYYSPQAKENRTEASDNRIETAGDCRKNLLYRLEMQWAVAVEIGFILTVTFSASSALCLLRVFGASLFAVSLTLMAIATASALLFIFWKEMKQPELRLRIFFFLLSLSCGLTIATGDAAVDFVRHYWRIVSAFTVVSASLLAIILVLVLINRFKT